MMVVGSCLAVSCLAGCLAVGAATIAAQDPPRLIKDLNATADGRRIGATDPFRYPLTASSYPDSPCSVGGVLYFLARDVTIYANDTTSRRRLLRYDPNSLGELITETELAGSADPRSLTVSQDGTLLFLAARATNAADPDRVFKVDAAATVTPLTFNPAQSYARVDSVAATSFGVEVLASTGANEGSAVHGLWRKNGMTNTLDRVAVAPISYDHVSHLVQIVGNGPDYPFYAFTAKRNASLRSLFLIRPTQGTQFLEIQVDNPAMLTPFGDKLMLVDVSGNANEDALRRVNGPTATTADLLTTRSKIRSLVTTNDRGIPRLFFRAGSSSPQLHTYDSGVSMPADADAGVPPESIASCVAIDNVVHVLGALGGITRLWVHDQGSNSLIRVEGFLALSAASSLAVWKKGSFRLAFLATTGGTTPAPVISVLSGGDWTSVAIPSVEPFTMPTHLTRVGSWLWFSAAHFDRGVEPFHWKHE